MTARKRTDALPSGVHVLNCIGEKAVYTRGLGLPRG